MSERTLRVSFHTGTCPFCGRPGWATLTRDQRKRYEMWRLKRNSKDPGDSIQVVLHDVSAGVREQLMTGTHPECFDDLFPHEED